MASYDRSYDYGMRGYDDSLRREGPAGRRVDRGAEGFGAPAERRRFPRTARVTARYNLDYVYGGRGEEDHPRNYNRFGGAEPRQIRENTAFRQPYTTIGGTRTFRGATEPTGYGVDFARYDRFFRRG